MSAVLEPAMQARERERERESSNTPHLDLVQRHQLLRGDPPEDLSHWERGVFQLLNLCDVWVSGLRSAQGLDT